MVGNEVISEINLRFQGDVNGCDAIVKRAKSTIVVTKRSVLGRVISNLYVMADECIAGFVDGLATKEKTRLLGFGQARWTGFCQSNF